MTSFESFITTNCPGPIWKSDLSLPFSYNYTLDISLPAKSPYGELTGEPSHSPEPFLLLITAATAEPQSLWGPVEAVSSFHFIPILNKLKKRISYPRSLLLITKAVNRDKKFPLSLF